LEYSPLVDEPLHQEICSLFDLEMARRGETRSEDFRGSFPVGADAVHPVHDQLVFLGFEQAKILVRGCILLHWFIPMRRQVLEDAPAAGLDPQLFFGRPNWLRVSAREVRSRVCVADRPETAATIMGDKAVSASLP
jgi:hypothetical protein